VVSVVRVTETFESGVDEAHRFFCQEGEETLTIELGLEHLEHLKFRKDLDQYPAIKVGTIATRSIESRCATRGRSPQDLKHAKPAERRDHVADEPFELVPPQGLSLEV